jgi:hypothetical protein
MWRSFWFEKESFGFGGFGRWKCFMVWNFLGFRGGLDV